MPRTQRSIPNYFPTGLIVLIAAWAVPLALAGNGIERITLTSPHGIVGVYPTADPEAVFQSDEVQPAATAAGWEKLTCPGGLYLRQISMVSPQVGYVCGEVGIVIKTTNGGASWQTILNQGFPYYWYGCQAFDENKVFLSGFQNQTGEGIIRWSDDGGASWGPVLALNSPFSLGWLSFCRFMDRDHGIIQGFFGVIQYTLSGGATDADWTPVRPTDNWYAGPFTYLPDGRAWMTGYDNFRSPDYGQTWEPIADADPLFDGPNSIRPSGHGFIGSGTISPNVEGWVNRTEDGGDSWSPRLLTTPYPIRALLTLDEKQAWAVGGNVYSNVGGIWSTSDGGDTWTNDVDTKSELLDINYVQVDSRTIDLYAVGMISQIWRLRYTLPGLKGDLNCDGSVDFGDINPFVLAISDPEGYAESFPGCDRMNADINGDGSVDFGDINPFVGLLSGK